MLSVVCLLISLLCTALCYRFVTHTTLIWAWVCAVLSGIVWLAAVGASTVAPASGVTDHLWYAAAVTALCPFVAVLGSRRPGNGAWIGFVVIPLCAVLEWPALSTLAVSGLDRPLALQTPALMCGFVVIVLATGNYLGTRSTIGVLLIATAISVAMISCSEQTNVASRAQLRLIASICMTFGVISATWLARRAEQRAEIGVHRLWSDLRNLIGTVWTHRLQERFNHFAHGKGLPIEMRAWGLVDEDGNFVNEVSDEVERTLRWLLKRFVDPPWIDARLSGTGQEVDASQAESDSG